MTSFNHCMTGAVITLAVKNPYLVVPLCFASHYLQDAIPHHDYFSGGGKKVLQGKFNVLLAFDIALSLALIVWFVSVYPDYRWILLAGMVTAASPDLAWGYHLLYKARLRNQPLRLGPVTRLHKRIGTEWAGAKGMAVEIGWFLLAGVLILQLR